ncbi:ABC transporter permease [Thermosphaera aggregans]|uniref:Binding-protein-dependent transport systems inner membrane component n=1 Tax=Thermosphaera aggregans (strain DSM 11486 / M11TL) TaxID=633148 RepID=D5U1H3_THEAM|nr:ABC transporter permease [Thermosphaera aggregans]ADG90973.1 binding-protein-dependent transport systems inner membrane component [Thermosphaera aggregans DSM 11486]
MASRKELTITDKFVLKVIRPLKNVLKDLVRYWTGRVGIAILIFLIATSIYAVLALPAGFIARWENAAYWDENPQWAPPTWISAFGIPVAESSIISKSRPDEPLVLESGRFVVKYTATYRLEQPAFPQDLVLKLFGIKVVNVSGVVYVPHIAMFVKRPDGSVIQMFESDVTLGGNETVEYIATRDLKPDIFDLWRISSSLATYYNFSIPLEIVGNNVTLQKIGESIIISKIRDEVRLKRSSFIFGLPVVDVGKKDQTTQLNSITSSLNSLIEKIDVTNEQVADIKQRLVDVKNLIDSLRDENKTLTDYLAALEKAKANLTLIWKVAFADLLLPPEQLDMLNSIIKDVSKYIEQLYTTDAFYNIRIASTPLTGKYEFTLEISYTAKDELREIVSSPADEVRIIVKGNVYGFSGTDDLGRDLTQVLLYGTPIALAIGLTTAIITTFIGVFAGIASGYYGGIIDEIIQRIADIIGNIPTLPILIILAQIAQTQYAQYGTEVKALMTILTIIGVLIVFGWGGLAITVRAMTLSIKEEPYIDAARALGASNSRIIFKHIFPQVAMYASASLVASVPGAILSEAGLSVLGIRHGWPTWGAILSRARDTGRYDIWWWIVPPGIMLSITSLAFILLGLAIEKIVEPRLRTL